MTRRAVCKNTEHHDEPIRGSSRERCSKCGDEFPCKRSCGHLDCMQARGEPPPEWADYAMASANATEVLEDRQVRKALGFAARTGMGPKRLLADHAAVSVDFGCTDETGHAVVSHVTIDGEPSLHMIPPGEYKAQLVSIDVVDGKLVQTIRVVEPKES